MPSRSATTWTAGCTNGVSRAAVMTYGNWVFDQTFFVILNQAVGGHFDGDPQSDAIFPATMLVDWVRVYRPSVH